MKILALLGPTASGKSALSIPLAKELGGEIISMDSRQVYRGMDIGTDKVPTSVRAQVPHHGLDLVLPSERYSAGRFGREARGWIQEIRARGRTPILVGGTGFFLSALTRPIFREPPLDEARRDRLRAHLAHLSLEELETWTRLLDPERAAVAIAGGRQRLARTLELPLLTGRPLSWWHRSAPATEEGLQVACVVLSPSRELLYRRIDARAADMFREGLLDEVAGLLGRGFTREAPGMSATGYREAAAVIEGGLTVGDAVERVQRATRAYARRQVTWFRNQVGEPRLELDSGTPIETQLSRILLWWQGIGHPTEG
jgi:tRNA dimethylallyltransferase